MEQLEPRMLLSASIAGNVFADANRDGLRGAQEAGLSAWTVYLDDNLNGARDGGEVSTTTGLDGEYSFTDLLAGTHEIALVTPDGWAGTSPVGATQSITVADSEVVSDADFGVVFDRIIDDGEAGNSTTGAWSSGSHSSGYNGDYDYHADGDGTSVATWSFDGLVDGHYEVSVRWRNAGSYTADAPFTVYDGDSATGEVEASLLVNQQIAPDGATHAGQDWQIAGVFEVTSGELSVTLHDDFTSGSWVIADAVRVQLVDGPADGPTLIDDGELGYSESGGAWSSGSHSSAHDSDYRYTASGSGGNIATWSFGDLDAGLYEVFATWRSASSYTADAPFSVLDGTDAEASLLVNQQIAPDDVTVDGQAWESLGRLDIGDGELNVELSADFTSGSWVIADAVRIEQVAAVPVNNPIDDGEQGYVESGSGWSSGAHADGFENDYRYHAQGTGSNVATWTIDGLVSGQYEVFATWRAAGSYTADAPFSIYDDATLVGQTLSNQQQAPDDATFDGQVWESLGVYDIVSGTLAVTLDDGFSSGSWVIADAIRAEFIVEIPPPPPPVPAPDVIDDGHQGYTESGSGWNSGSHSTAFEDDYRYAAKGNGNNVASWTFENLDSGFYEVLGTWRAASSYTADAPFTILDGISGSGVVEANLLVNQQITPDDTTIEGHAWDVFGVFEITSGMLTVELSDDFTSGSWVLADVPRPLILAREIG